jgi:hypothetical protein
MKEREPFVDDDVGLKEKNKQKRRTGGFGGWQLVKDAF